jgi:hypothetical protein
LALGSTNTAPYPTGPISRDLHEPSIPDRREDETPAVEPVEADDRSPTAPVRSLTARRWCAKQSLALLAG